MDKEIKYGTENGQMIAGEDMEVRPQAGAIELTRIVDALRGGQTPDPGDVATVKALHPDNERGIAIDTQLVGLEPADLISDFHNADPKTRQRAWETIISLLPPSPLDLTPLSEIGLPPDRKWLIKDWLPRGRIGMLTGAGGRGKSWLALQLAATMATGGGEWVTRGVNKKMPAIDAGPVLYATWEDEKSEFVRRIGVDKAAKCKGLHIIDLAGSGPVWGLPVGSSIQARGSLLEIGRELRAAAEFIRANLLILDSLAGAYGGNENDRAAVREFMAHWDAWGRATDCTVMLIAHPPKDQERAGSGGYSGSTDWHGASRWRWELSGGGKDDDRERLSCEKASYAMRPDPVYLLRVDKTADGLIAGQWKEAADQTMPDAANSAGQCRGETQAGTRCKKRALTDGYCDQHQNQACNNGTESAAEREWRFTDD